MRDAGRRVPAQWWHHVLLWPLLAAVPAAKSVQIVADDPPMNDLTRQLLIVLAVGIAAAIVVAAATRAEAAPLAMTRGRRLMIALGLRPDPELAGDPTLCWWRWGLALGAAVLAAAAASGASDGWVRWPVAGLAAVALGGLVAAEILRYRTWSWQRAPARNAQPTALWTAGPVAGAAIGSAIALGVSVQASGLDGGRLAELVVITAFGEELIFRGALLVLAYRVLKPAFAHVVVALSFGLWHVGDAWVGSRGDPIGQQTAQIVVTVLVTFVGGLFFIFLRERGRTLLASTLGHVAINLPGIAL